MFGRRAGVFEQHGIGPMQVVFRGAGHDGAHAVDKAAMIFAIQLGVWIPEREVLRVERALGDNRVGVN